MIMAFTKCHYCERVVLELLKFVVEAIFSRVDSIGFRLMTADDLQQKNPFLLS